MTDRITHALLSVSDKTGLIPFAQALTQLNITLIATGGTSQILKENGIPFIEISQFTGFSEIMAGRVKTLHPKIYAGILARPEEDEILLAEHDFPLIGLVVVNLYPFEKVILSSSCTLEQAIENIDIGGPTLLRAAAKNYKHTTVVVDQADYGKVLNEINDNAITSMDTRLKLAQKVFAHVAHYDGVISNYFASLNTKEGKMDEFPDTYSFQVKKKMDLRYGENPHQAAAFYTLAQNVLDNNISNAIQHTGKPLSYNNIADADAALECVRQFTLPACVIVKHANPCAVALSNNLIKAYELALACDPQSSFGGIIAFNQTVTKEMIETIYSKQFVEVIICPTVSEEALEYAKQKPNVRILTVNTITSSPIKSLDFKSVGGGLLLQHADNQPTPESFEVMTKRQPSEQELADLLFAWQVVRYVKSNAIVYAKNNVTLGIGAGQMSRVFSSKIAIEKAHQTGLSIQHAVMASDAFFPFPDSIEEAAKAGVTAIIQPGGSMRDQEIIQAADEHHLTMLFTHRRHFKH